jgi:putative SOS response-associated peptidase YedK
VSGSGWSGGWCVWWLVRLVWDGSVVWLRDTGRERRGSVALMCGRYAASRRPEDLAGLFGVEKWDPSEAPAPDWNVAPTKDVYAVLERPLKGADDPRPVRQLRVLRWGLVPSWSASPEGGARMINARVETVHEKPSYRRPFAARRCLVPADGYYEWATGSAERTLEEQGRRKRPRKQPYFVTPADGSVMAMAGLFEFWRDKTLPDDHPRAWWATFTILTTEAEKEPFARPASETQARACGAGSSAAGASGAGPLGAGASGAGAGASDGDRSGAAAGAFGADGSGAGAPADEGPRSLAEIHPRMPLVLPPDRWAAWLDPAQTDIDALRPLLAPPAAGLLRAYPVGSGVSDVRNNGPELVTELPAPESVTLF